MSAPSPLSTYRDQIADVAALRFRPMLEFISIAFKIFADLNVGVGLEAQVT